MKANRIIIKSVICSRSLYAYIKYDNHVAYTLRAF